MTLETERHAAVDKMVYTVTPRDSGNLSKIRIEKNCNTHGSAGECAEKNCRVITNEGTYYMAIYNQDEQAYLYAAFSDEEMQELFMAYLAVREEIGL